MPAGEEEVEGVVAHASVVPRVFCTGTCIFLLVHRWVNDLICSISSAYMHQILLWYGTESRSDAVDSSAATATASKLSRVEVVVRVTEYQVQWSSVSIPAQYLPIDDNGVFLCLRST